MAPIALAISSPPGKGSCHVTVTLSTGNDLENSPGKAFQQSMLVTVR